MSDAGYFLLDIGNSAAKWLHGRDQRILDRGAGEIESITQTLDQRDRRASVLVSSVASTEVEESLSRQLVQSGRDVWFARSQAAHGDLRNAYAEPRRMGVDRWLAMVAGRARSAARFCVVDAGTALTIDVVDDSGRHEGGYIVPGSALMARSLALDTHRVRFELPEKSSLAPGNSTEQAVGHGILLAQLGAVELALKEASKNGPVPRLLLCGGGAAAITGFLSSEVVLVPNLVFEGLLLQAAVLAPGLLDVDAALAALRRNLT